MTGGWMVAFFIGRDNMRELWNMLQAVLPESVDGWVTFLEAVTDCCMP